jgi:hypothetical protein
MTRRPDVLVSKILHLLDRDFPAEYQGLCTTGADDVWTWALRGGPFADQWHVTITTSVRTPAVYSVLVTWKDANMLQQQLFRNTKKSAKILAATIKNFRVEVRR